MDDAWVLLIIAAVFWLFQFISLMNMKEDEFVGRHDKPIWAAALIFTLVLGALAFWFWKRSRIPSQAGKKLKSDIDRVVEEVKDLGGSQR